MSFTQDTVDAWETTVTFPTYEISEPDPNPMFLEKRVYQGSSGVVYPFPIVDKVFDTKEDRDYSAVYLENEFLELMILPELGGRIHMAYDKKRDYHFVYYNRVIKPALVGLAGPWIAGGIEFNWPQHHRPSTFHPVDYTVEERQDGAATVWLSEIDRMYGTQATVGITLEPGRAYFEIEARLYNRTDHGQTFLWWANPAVAVNDQYQAIFPPDVTAVFDHIKRDVSRFPVATGTYYKIDYSAGVDISWYKNIPVPTSYMAYRSRYDFVGGYDHGKGAGILHVADHHVSPGKKLWTWGNGDFGKAWEMNLTDEDGPYVELMTGVFTDNQPDFTWMRPYETKTFYQYFMPYGDLGLVKNANKDVLVTLVLDGDGQARWGVHVTQARSVHVRLADEERVYAERVLDLSPESAHVEKTPIAEGVAEHDLVLSVTDTEGAPLIRYRPEAPSVEPPPEPAQAAADPQEIQTNEELYLQGLHQEQYRHPTYRPEPFYREALERDAADARNNIAMGSLELRRGLFAKAESHFRSAIARLTKHNPNPYDCEAHFKLGVALKHQGRREEAHGAFYKAAWDGAWQGQAYFALAQLATERGDAHEALAFLDESLAATSRNRRALHLKAALLRRSGGNEAAAEVLETLEALDPLNAGAAFERYLSGDGEALERATGREPHDSIELALDYGSAGLWNEGVQVLEYHIDKHRREDGDHEALYPMIFYYQGSFLLELDDAEAALDAFRKAAAADSRYCFPNRLEAIQALTRAGRLNPGDARCWYYLGNLWYDKRQYEEAIEAWEKSKALDGAFPTVHRNLALAYYNKRGDSEAAQTSLGRAFALDESDSRVLFELDQLHKKLNRSVESRLAFLEQYPTLVSERDDLYTEHCSLLNFLGRNEEALAALLSRRFHPWEGGEGKVTGQYVFAQVELGKRYLRENRLQEAQEALLAAKDYPRSLGEGKLVITQENNIDYWIGRVAQAQGRDKEARDWLRRATEGASELGLALYYNDQPADLLVYQGFAFQALGEPENARSVFNTLVDFGEQHVFDEVKIDYFAVSLPDFLVFDADLNSMNRVLCHYLMGLGKLGLGLFAEAEHHLRHVLELDAAHQGARIHLEMVHGRDPEHIAANRAGRSKG